MWFIRYFIASAGLFVFGYGIEFNVTNQPYDILLIIIGGGFVMAAALFGRTQ